MYIRGRSSSANSKAIWVPTNSSGNTWMSSSMGTSRPGTGMGTATVIVTVVWHDFRSTLFYFAKSNLFPTLVDLIFLLILSIHVTLILSYPSIFTFILTHSLSFFQMRCLFYMTSRQEHKDYLLVCRRTIFLGQLKGDLALGAEGVLPRG